MGQNVYGHGEIVEHFRRVLEAGRLASAYLFVGPEGVGKRTFALQLAKSLLCTAADPESLSACGRCQACILCDAGGHPDLHVVERRPGVKFLQIDQFVGDRERRHREGMCHDLALRPLMGRRRIGIIDDADWFNQESANCLLKLLEEPPPGAVLILVGTSRSRQLPTILSRVQTVRFRGIPSDDLRKLIVAQQLAADDENAARLGEQASGSLARARELADSTLGQVAERFAAEWQSSDFDPTRLLREVDDFVASGGKDSDSRRQRFRQLLLRACDTLRLELRDSAIAGRPPEATLAALDRTLEAEEQLDRNANQATLLECWLDDLAAISAQ